MGSALARLLATTTSSNDEFPDDNFFPDVSDLFGNLNMDDNTDAATTAAATAAAAAAAQTASYVYLNLMFQFVLEFLILAFGVDVIDLVYLDAICSSTLLICMINFSTVYMIMLC